MQIQAGLRTCARMGLLVGAVALAVAGAGCASRGALGAGPVPKPFPVPDSTRRGSEAPAPVEQPADAPPVATGPAIAPAPVPPSLSGATDSYALVGTALDLRGAPYRDGGADPRGFDCSGFTQYVFGQHGLRLPRATRDQFKLGKAVEPDALAPGDLLFFTTTTPGASHVGIAVGTDQFVHAPSSTGVVRVERLGSSYWSQRFIGARRVD